MNEALAPPCARLSDLERELGIPGLEIYRRRVEITEMAWQLVGWHDSFAPHRFTIHEQHMLIRGVVQGMRHLKGGELVWADRGGIQLCFLDLRARPLVKQTIGLKGWDGFAVYVPPGVAYGILGLEDLNIFTRRAEMEHSQESGFRFDDDLASLPWMLDGYEPFLSSEDRRLPRLRDYLARLE